MLRKISKLIAAVSLTMATGLQSAMAGYMDTLNMREGVTPISREVYSLHMLVVWICVGIGVVVFGAMIYSMIMHRKSKGHEAATFHESTKMEILWTIAPFVILVGMAIPATKTLVFMSDTTESDIEIKVTGHQWKWEYDYLGEDISIISSLSDESRQGIYEDPTAVDNYLLDVDNEVVLPVGKKIRFLLTASDVIHAWWVPDLGQKQDAIPGFVNEMWTQIDTPGVYRGQCAELCGKDHAFMPIVVRAVSEEEYASWLA
jgi:cytochrome c oxidase subunit 2